MKVAPQYRAGMDVNGFNVVLLKDSEGHFILERHSLEELYEELSENYIRNSVEVLAIYPDVNPAAIGKINEAANKLKNKEIVDLENLLK